MHERTHIVSLMLLVVLITISCDATVDQPPAEEEDSAPPSSEAEEERQATNGERFPDAVLRDCATSILASGAIGERAMDFGAIAFDNMAEWLPADPPPPNDDGRFPGLKYAAAVPGDVSYVALVIPEAHRSTFALLYERPFRRDNFYAIADGRHSVVFEPCEGRSVTWFNGGFVLADPQCAPLDMYVGDEQEPTRIVLPFRDQGCP